MPIGSVSAGINHRKIRTLPRPAHFELGEADGAHYQTACPGWRLLLKIGVSMKKFDDIKSTLIF